MIKKSVLLALTFILWTSAVFAQSVPAANSPMVPNVAAASLAPGVFAGGNYNPQMFDHIGDSRTSLMLVAGGYALTTQHWWNHANVLAGHRYVLGINQGQSGCRTDQYLQPSNFNPLLSTPAKFVIFGFPAVNDLGAGGTGCTISPGGGSYPYTNANGVSVNMSNVASVAVGNIIAAVKQIVAVGKTVILTEEPGATGINNTPATVVSFTGATASNVLTVSAVTSGASIVPGQTLTGGFVPANSLIMAQLTGTGGATCPDQTCTGGVGTYSITTNVGIAAEAMTGTYNLMAAMYEFNMRLRAFAAATPGVYFWSANSVLWNPTAAVTAVAFLSNYSTDGTHYSALGAQAAGKAFNTFFQSTFPSFDSSWQSSSQNLVSPTGSPRSLITNPLFTPATGGSVSGTGCGTITGSPPTGWFIACHNANTTVTFTNASDSGGFGNDITIAIANASAADGGVNFGPTTFALQGWNLTDIIQAGATVTVSSQTAAELWLQAESVTTGGNSQQFDMYYNGITTGLPATPYTWQMQTLAKPPAAGTKQFLIPLEVSVVLNGAGSAITYTISRPWAIRGFNYNPQTGAFSGGYLLKRDIDPASNDNDPMWLDKAA